MTSIQLERPDGDLRGWRWTNLFATLLGAFLAISLLSWPIVFSFRLWVFADRGNLLNVDYLVAQGLRPGVDTFYSYGLLPIALQHVAFAFGRGYAPMLAFSLLSMVLMALIWARMFRELPRSPPWLGAVLAISPCLLWVNPNFPYSLVLLSMLGALALVLRQQLPAALALAAVGCWSVPSLPLVLVALLIGLCLIEARTTQALSPAELARRLGPGLAAYLGIGVVLAALYGPESVLATALPFQGARFYALKGYGLGSLREFLSPANAGLRWYLFTRSGWWLFSTPLLFVLAALGVRRMLRARALHPLDCVVALLAVLHGVFAFFMGGPQSQHLVYDPLLAGGTLLALSRLPANRLRASLLALFAATALLGHGWQIRDTWRAWREQSVAEDTAGLYAPRDFAQEWQRIVEVSRAEPLLLLNYATGVHHYFPSVRSPAVWVLEVGQVLPIDEERILLQLAEARVVVEPREGSYAQHSPRLDAYLDGLCPPELTRFFRISRRRDERYGCAYPPLLR